MAAISTSILSHEQPLVGGPAVGNAVLLHKPVETSGVYVHSATGMVTEMSPIVPVSD